MSSNSELSGEAALKPDTAEWAGEARPRLPSRWNICLFDGRFGRARSLRLILSARDFDADRAQEYGTINRALDADEIGPDVEELANRIAQFPAESIEACKRTVYASVDLPIHDALKEEAYWLYQSMSKTPAQKRFQYADDNGAQNDMDNQRNWDQLVIGIQEVQ